MDLNIAVLSLYLSVYNNSLYDADTPVLTTVILYDHYITTLLRTLRSNFI